MKTLLLLGCCVVLAAATPAPAAVEVRRAVPADPPPAQFSEEPAGVNDASRFIAGLPPSGNGPLWAWTQDAGWNAFSQILNDSWLAFDGRHLEPIRSWRTVNLADVNPATVFYPFSGPDYIHARALFPDAATYILCGLEPVGTTPVPENLQPLTATLGWTQVSIKTLMEAGYFVTKEMKTQFKQSPLQGVVPVICLMMARDGDRIVSVQSDGTRAEIRFVVPGDRRIRTLHYFSLNLRDDGLRKGSPFLRFIHASQPDVGYLKSASYLLHEKDFSTIRNALLNECRVILQDDSGIPLKAFSPARWAVRNYGVYAPPLDIFKQYTQPDLAGLYARLPSAPLPFGVGYQWNPKKANLLLFTKVR